jgi:hypothetical protein
MKKQITWLVTGLLLASLLAACAPAAAPAPQVVQETVVVKETVPAIQETVLVPAPTSDPALADVASPVTLSVSDPSGGIEVSQLFSPRLSDLNGATICEVSNGMWESARTFPLISQLLQKQFPTAKIVSYDQFPTAATAVNQKLIDAVKAAGCQAVIIGNAG